MKVSNLIKRLAYYIEKHGDNEVIFNLPKILNATQCKLTEDRGKLYIELTEVKVFSDFMNEDMINKIERITN